MRSPDSEAILQRTTSMGNTIARGSRNYRLIVIWKAKTKTWLSIPKQIAAVITHIGLLPVFYINGSFIV